ncbi:ABC-type lipoprotein release transport system permease subunit [Bacillus oleivorans]|uniref:ABC-type lipoprotein release transport system permease subunit n=1 Tax=Bacillus oleivorans TaxID=1448271 RepID=A0A285CKH9_9BACI|nr:FtsX-like permease family protein [Bacillus oleivorans]SNX68019.1 ABC-type lipoprotein release transport system permease subunit [Bacillus oleivorans]
MSLQRGVFRTVWKRKVQSIGAILLLFIAVMLYIMMTNSLSSLDKSYRIFNEDYVQEDFHFIAANKIEESQADRLEEELSIQLEKRSFADVSLEGEETLRILTVSNEVNLPYVSEGELPQSENEIALSEKFAGLLSLNVGELIHFNGESYTISGLVYLPDYVYPVENEANLLSMPGSFGVSVMTEAGLAATGLPLITQYMGVIEQNTDLTKLKKEINDVVPVLKWVNASENPGISTFETEVEGSKSFSALLPLIITLLAIMMVTLLAAKQIEWERKQIGTLKALGFTKGELLKAYISLPLLVGLAGTILGGAAGWLLSTPVQVLYTDFYHIPPITSVGNPFIFLWAITVPVFLILLISGIAIYRKVSSDLLSLMKGSASGELKQNTLQGNWVVSRFSNFQTKYRIRALLRSKSRVFYMLVGSIFSSVTLLFGFLSMNSMDTLFTDTYQNVNKYNYAVHYSGIQTDQRLTDDEPFTLIQAELDSIKDNDQEKSVAHQTVAFYGVDPSVTLVDLSVGETNGDIAKALAGGVIINQVVAYTHDLEVGDEISLISSTNSEAMTFAITGIVESYTGASIYTDRAVLNELAGFPEHTYTGKWTMEEPDDQSAIFMMEDKTEIVDSFESMMGPSRYSILITAGIAIFIGVLIMSLLTNMILEENTYTISMLKVLGYENKAVAKMVLNLYTAVVIVGYLLSIPLSLMAMESIVKYLAGETSFALPVELSPIWLAAGLLIMLLTYQLSLFVSKRKIGKISLQEVMTRQD